MMKYQPEWVFDLSLQLAMAVGLSMLVLGLFVGAAPLTVLWRSGLVFTVFMLLGWVTSLIWQTPGASEVITSEADNETTSSNRKETSER